jgi:hypothetical protein
MGLSAGPARRPGSCALQQIYALFGQSMKRLSVAVDTARITAMPNAQGCGGRGRHFAAKQRPTGECRHAVGRNVFLERVASFGQQVNSADCFDKAA